MEEADGGVFVPLEHEQAINGVERAVVSEQRELGTDKKPRVLVEEPNVPAQPAVARVEAVAFGEHHPAARVETRVGDAAA